jgi:hypothetical protein
MNQLADLALRGFHYSRMTVSCAGYPHSGGEIEVAPIVGVKQVNPVSFDGDNRRGLPKYRG